MRYPDRMAEFVRCLETEGPNISRISQAMDEDEATLRYWLTEKLIKRGFVVRAFPNHQAIGLTRVAVVARVSAAYRGLARKVFDELSETGYLIYEVCDVLNDSYLIVFSIPPGLVDEVMRVLSGLKDMGFIEAVDDPLTFEWARQLPMKADNFDFRTLKWEMNLSKQIGRAEVSIKPVKRQKFDMTDLQILQRLQVDAFVSAREIADHLKLNYRKVLRHLDHVKTRRLVAYYRVTWPRTAYDPIAGKPRSVTHSYMGVTLVVKDVKSEELETLMLGVHRLPFVAVEWGGKNYFCEVLVPLELANEVLTYVRQLTSPFEGRKRLSISSTDAISYSIEPRRYDSETKRWTLDAESSLERIRALLPTAKSAVSSRKSKAPVKFR